MDNQSMPEAQHEEVSEKTSTGECTDLIDIMEEKQALLLKEIKDNKAAKTEPDLEANTTGATINEANSKPPRAPTTREQLMALRSKPIDNIRTAVICLIVIQYAMMGAISYHPNSFQLDQLAPKTYTVITLFIATGRVLFVPLLFFVSGFASHFALAAHSTNVFSFLIKKTWCTTLNFFAFRNMTLLSKYLHGPVPELGGAGTSVPYYASKAGRDALLNGPTYYILALLLLDYVYVVFWIANRLIFGETSHVHFINSPKRYKIWKYVFLVFLEGWIIFSAGGLAISRLPESVHKWMYLSNSAELHFPFLYLIAYFAGIQFISYYKFLLAEHKANKLFSLIVRLIVSAIGLTAMYRHFPETIHPYLDVRVQPALSFVTGTWSNNAIYRSDSVYGMWAIYTIIVVGEGFVQAFFNTRILMLNWGTFSRHSFTRLHVQLLFVGGSSLLLPTYIDNIIIQGVSTAFLSLFVGYIYAFILAGVETYAKSFARSYSQR